MSLREDLSKVLKQAKKVSGITYDELVLQSSYSKSTIRYALNGGSKTSLDVFDKLFQCCGVKSLTIEVDFTDDTL